MEYTDHYIRAATSAAISAALLAAGGAADNLAGKLFILYAAKEDKPDDDEAPGMRPVTDRVRPANPCRGRPMQKPSTYG